MFAALPHFVFASEHYTTTTLVAKIFALVLNPVIQFLMIAATVLFLWGIVQFIASGGDVEKLKIGKNHIIWGIAGLFIMVSAWGILKLECEFFDTCELIREAQREFDDENSDDIEPITNKLLTIEPESILLNTENPEQKVSVFFVDDGNAERQASGFFAKQSYAQTKIDVTSQVRWEFDTPQCISVETDSGGNTVIRYDISGTANCQTTLKAVYTDPETKVIYSAFASVSVALSCPINNEAAIFHEESRLFSLVSSVFAEEDEEEIVIVCVSPSQIKQSPLSVIVQVSGKGFSGADLTAWLIHKEKLDSGDLLEFEFSLADNNLKFVDDTTIRLTLPANMPVGNYHLRVAVTKTKGRVGATLSSALEVTDSLQQDCQKLSGNGSFSIVLVCSDGFSDTNEDQELCQQRTSQLKSLNFDPLTPTRYTMYKSTKIGENTCGAGNLNVFLIKSFSEACGWVGSLMSPEIFLTNNAFDSSGCGSPVGTLAHEAGHAIAALYDEYESESLKWAADRMYGGPRNCIRIDSSVTNPQQSACQYFKTLVGSDACFQGCLGWGDNTGPFWRDAVKSLMGTGDANSFGPASKYFLNKIMNKF